MKFWILLALTASVLPPMPSRLLADQGLKTSPSSPEAREIRVEADPDHEQACFSMGRITIDYASREVGPPNVGFRITDPRGRQIGYDPRVNRGWQEMPLAQAFLDCEENEDTGELRHCKDHDEICGPISGTYQIDLLPIHSGEFSMSAWAASQRTQREAGYDTTSSRADWKSEMHELKPMVLLLRYSREAGTQLTLTSDQQSTDRVSSH